MRFSEVVPSLAAAGLQSAGLQTARIVSASPADDPVRGLAALEALAREQCLRVLRTKSGTLAAGVPGMTGDRADVRGQARLRALFEEAAAGLGAGSREVIELWLRQGFADSELAAVLGVPRSRVHLLLARAGTELESCLGVLLVGRTGREDCGDLARLLAGWDGRLTAALRSRVHRHIGHCVTCGDRRTAELNRGLLAGRPPGAALAAGAAESFRSGPGVPAELRARTIALAAGHGPGAAGHGSAVLARTAAFGPEGFPRSGGRRRAGHAQAVIAAAAVFAVAATAVALASGSGGRHLPGHPGPDRRVSGTPTLAHRDPARSRPLQPVPGPDWFRAPDHSLIPHPRPLRSWIEPDRLRRAHARRRRRRLDRGR